MNSLPRHQSTDGAFHNQYICDSESENESEQVQKHQTDSRAICRGESVKLRGRTISGSRLARWVKGDRRPNKNNLRLYVHFPPPTIQHYDSPDQNESPNTKKSTNDLTPRLLPPSMEHSMALMNDLKTNCTQCFHTRQEQQNGRMVLVQEQDYYDLQYQATVYLRVYGAYPAYVDRMLHQQTTPVLKRSVRQRAGFFDYVKCSRSNYHLVTKSRGRLVPMLHRTLSILRLLHSDRHLDWTQMKRLARKDEYYDHRIIDKYSYFFNKSCQVCGQRFFDKKPGYKSYREDIMVMISEAKLNKVQMKPPPPETLDPVIFNMDNCQYDCENDQYEEKIKQIIDFHAHNRMTDYFYTLGSQQQASHKKKMKEWMRMCKIVKCHRGTLHLWKIRPKYKNITFQHVQFLDLYRRIPMRKQLVYIARRLHGPCHLKPASMISLVKKTSFSFRLVKQYITNAHLQFCQQCSKCQFGSQSHAVKIATPNETKEMEESSVHDEEEKTIITKFEPLRIKKEHEDTPIFRDAPRPQLYEQYRNFGCFQVAKIDRSAEPNSNHQYLHEGNCFLKHTKLQKYIDAMSIDCPITEDKSDHHGNTWKPNVCEPNECKCEPNACKPNVCESNVCKANGNGDVNLSRQPNSYADLNFSIQIPNEIFEKEEDADSVLQLEPHRSQKSTLFLHLQALQETVNQHKGKGMQVAKSPDSNTEFKVVLIYTQELCENYQDFGDCLHFQEFTELLESQETWHTFLFAGVDNYGRNRLFAAGLLTEISMEAYYQAFTMFFVCMKASRYPQSIVTDYQHYINEAVSAIAANLRNSHAPFSHFYFWHSVVQKYAEAVPQQNREGVKGLIMQTLKAQTISGFVTSYREVKKYITQEQSRKFISHASQYALSMMDKVFVGKAFDERRHSSFCNILREHIQCQITLSQFVAKVLSTDASLVRQQTERILMMGGSMDPTSQDNLFSFLSPNHVEQLEISINQTENASIAKIIWEKSTLVIFSDCCSEYTVKYNISNQMWQCSCRRLERFGFPCTHLLTVVRKNNGSIPLYINSRWFISNPFRVESEKTWLKDTNQLTKREEDEVHQGKTDM